MENESELNAMEDDLFNLEVTMGLMEYISLEDIQEEIKLLANSMSTYKALADKMGISPQYLNDLIKGTRKPGPMVQKFLKVKAVTVYVEVD